MFLQLISALQKHKHNHNHKGKARGVGLMQALGEFMIPGAAWNKCAGSLIMYFLEPAIVSFAFGLYARRHLLKANFVAIMASSFSSALGGILLLSSIARLVGVPQTMGMALMPRATTALAVTQARMIGVCSPARVFAWQTRTESDRDGQAD